MKPYVVKQGDYLAKIAHALGFDAEEVWNAPENAALRASRKPDLLNPCDILFVPGTTREPLLLRRGITNRYSAKVPKTSVVLVFRSLGGALAHEPYVVRGLGAPREGTTDGEGRLVLEMPVHLRECQVFFPRQNTVYPVQVGDMDPIDEPSGVRKRLEHLGYRRPEESQTSTTRMGDDVETSDRMAILAFQKARGLKLTGLMDDATLSALSEAHGA